MSWKFSAWFAVAGVFFHLNHRAREEQNAAAEEEIPTDAEVKPAPDNRDHNDGMNLKESFIKSDVNVSTSMVHANLFPPLFPILSLWDQGFLEFCITHQNCARG